MKLKKATASQIDKICEIIQSAIRRRKNDGSTQWQDGYPNRTTIQEDINTKSGYVLMENSEILAYVCVKINDEPAYENIEGKWLSNSDFLVIHRVAVAEKHLGKGMAKKLFQLIENIGIEQKIYSIKVDTNFDNKPMLSIFKRLGYQYCGKVYFDIQERMAYEKILQPNPQK